MVKVHVMTSIEPSLYERAKARHLNMSAMLEDALVSELCVDMKKEEKEAAEKAIKEMLNAVRIKEQHDFAKKCVTEMFKELTGLDMSDEEFEDYHERFKSAEKGWNIHNYIKEQGLNEQIQEGI